MARLLGLYEGGGAWQTVLARVAHLNLDVSHLPATSEVAPTPSAEHLVVSDEELKAAVFLSSTWAEVLRRLDRTGEGTHKAIKRRATHLGLDVSHFCGQGWSRGRRFGPKRTPEEVLVLRDPASAKERPMILRRALLAVGVPHTVAPCARSRPSGTANRWSCP
ncbi:MAG: hypothetical protein H0U04_16635 [Rubrobacter sp.]|nr:hypothetical protein [Rubrobacter sp.]